MSYQKFVTYTIIQLILFGIAIVGLLYMYDPLQIYHKPYFRDTAFIGHMRLQNKGLIKHYDFTHYILGTSMLENSLASDMQREIGGKWVNLSMSGATFDERAVILHYLFRHKKPQHIMYSLDGTLLIHSQPKDTATFDYLYDTNPYNDMQVYMSDKFLWCAFLFSNAKICVDNQNLEELVSWKSSDKYGINKFLGGFKNWIQHNNTWASNAIDLKQYENKTTFSKSQETLDITTTKDYIQKYLLSFIQTHPDTHFSLIIPPYSLLHWRLNSGEYLALWQQAIIYIVESCEKLSNVTIYGFDDLPYTTEIANYADTTHYDSDMNTIFIQAIKNKTHIINQQNIHKYLQTMEQKIINYDLNPFIDMLKENEREKN